MPYSKISALTFGRKNLALIKEPLWYYICFCKVFRSQIQHKAVVAQVANKNTHLAQEFTWFGWDLKTALQILTY